jgi:hypothetical protein
VCLDMTNQHNPLVCKYNFMHVGENKHHDNSPTRAVYALEELQGHEEELRRTSLAISGNPLDLFNETVWLGFEKNENIYIYIYYNNILVRSDRFHMHLKFSESYIFTLT